MRTLNVDSLNISHPKSLGGREVWGWRPILKMGNFSQGMEGQHGTVEPRFAMLVSAAIF